jgi:hypothetical protein
VTLFNATTGAKIAANDDGNVVGPLTGDAYDSFLISDLSPGSYTATLTH